MQFDQNVALNLIELKFAANQDFTMSFCCFLVGLFLCLSKMSNLFVSGCFLLSLVALIQPVYLNGILKIIFPSTLWFKILSLENRPTTTCKVSINQSVSASWFVASVDVQCCPRNQATIISMVSQWCRVSRWLVPFLNRHQNTILSVHIARYSRVRFRKLFLCCW